MVEIMIVVAIIGMLAAVAIPNLMRSSAKGAEMNCFTNQRTINANKLSWATDNNKVGSKSASPSMDDLKDYFEGKKLPKCRSGGSYTVGDMSTSPTCSEHGCYLDEAEEGDEGDE